MFIKWLLTMSSLQSLSDALISLQMVYPRRNLSADQWRNAQLLSLISAPSTMLNPAQSDTVSQCDTETFSYYTENMPSPFPVVIGATSCLSDAM